MAKYRKKPIEIEAIQLQDTEESIANVLRFMGQKVDLKNDIDHYMFDDYCYFVKEKGLEIYTLEGIMTASIDDYIIQGVNGEFYPCIAKCYCSEDQYGNNLVPYIWEHMLMTYWGQDVLYWSSLPDIPKELINETNKFNDLGFNGKGNYILNNRNW